MAESIRRILNNRLDLSKPIGKDGIESAFSNGYLFAEILYKFGVQPDFCFVLDANDDEIKIRNFARVLLALESLSITLSPADAVKIMNRTPGIATRLVYQLLKRLEVMPIRDPNWSVQTAKKFERRDSWAELARSLNLSYEAYRQLCDRYDIPGEKRCAEIESVLRATLHGGIHLNTERKGTDRNETDFTDVWQGVVESELRQYEAQKPTTLCANTPLLEEMAKSTRAAPVTSLDPQCSALKLISNGDFEEGAENEQLIPDQALETIKVYVETNGKAFQEDEYRKLIKERKRQYEEQRYIEASAKQLEWIDRMAKEKEARERTMIVEKLYRMNLLFDRWRRKSRLVIQERRRVFNDCVTALSKASSNAAARNLEYARVMVNNGFWDMNSGDFTDEETLKLWCRKAGISYDANLYQVLSRGYNMCNNMLLTAYDDGFDNEFRKLAVNDGEVMLKLFEDQTETVEEVVDEKTEIAVTGNVPIQSSSAVDCNEMVPFRATDQPVLYFNDKGFEEYCDLLESIQPEPVLKEKRHLGHILACCMNKPQPPETGHKLPVNFVSILLFGRRKSQLKNVVLRKLAEKYNLEIISVADLLEEALEAILAQQEEAAGLRERNLKNSDRKSKGVMPAKKGSLTRAMEGRTRSVASPASSLMMGAGRSSPKLEQMEELIRKLMEKNNLDLKLLVDIIEREIRIKVIHFHPVGEQHEDVPHAPTTRPKGTPDATLNREGGEHHPENPPFGWILTDIPADPVLVDLLEKRLGSSKGQHATVWHQDESIPDAFGPKPEPKPQSMFNAVVVLDLPDETNLLPTTTENSIDALTMNEKEPAIVAAGSKLKPATPTQFEAEVAMKKLSSVAKQHIEHVTEFGSYGEMYKAWSWLKDYYSNRDLKIVKRIDNWIFPKAAFAELCGMVEASFKDCMCRCNKGITTEAMLHLEKVVNEVCTSLLRQRQSARHQLARHFVGLASAKKIFEHIAQHDKQLHQRVQSYCRSRLKHILRHSPREVKSIGIALYRKTRFNNKLCGRANVGRCNHRYNRLHCRINRLRPPTDPLTIHDFPCLGPESGVIDEWHDLQRNYKDEVRALMDELYEARHFVAADNLKMRVTYRDYLNNPTTELDVLMRDFEESIARMKLSHPDMELKKMWAKRIRSLELQLSDICDQRHFKRVTTVDHLRSRGAGLESIACVQNVTFDFLRAEVKYFRNIVRFLFRAFVATQGLQWEEFLALPRFILPKLKPGADKLETDVAPAEWSGDFIKKMVSSIEIAESTEYWEKIHMLIKFMVDECASVCITKFKSLFLPTEQLHLPMEDESHIIHNNCGESGERNEKTGLNDGESPDSWLETLERFDMEDLLHHVNCADAKDQTKLLQQNGTQNDKHHPKCSPRKMLALLVQTIEQEKQVCLSKVSMIEQLCASQCAAAESHATETFCILNSWVDEIHVREQLRIDSFIEKLEKTLL